MYPLLLQHGSLLIPTYGVIASIALLSALLLSLKTAPQHGLHAGGLWNLCVIAVFSGSVAAKLIFIISNWHAFRTYPLLMLSLSTLRGAPQMISAVLVALVTGALYARTTHLSFLRVADALAAPLAVASGLLSLACLAAGCDYGSITHAPWGITFHSLYAAVWSGTPLGVPLQPVQIYAAVADEILAAILFVAGGWKLAAGYLAGIALFLAGCIHFVLYFFRGDALSPVLHLPWIVQPQIAALLCVICGGLLWLRSYDTPSDQSNNSAFERTSR